MSSKSVIVTADDFGYSAAVNAAVVEAHRRGILRFASLMVLRSSAAEAAAMARDCPGLGVGLHLELCAERPEAAGLRYFFDPRARAQLRGEIRRQIEGLLALGVRPTHVDGHFNIHVHPVIFPALCELAREYGIPRVRLPRGEISASLDYEGDALLPKIVLAATFGAIGAWVRSWADGLEVSSAWGLLRSGMMTEDYLLHLLERLPLGKTELYFHPCADPASAVTGRPTPTHHTVTELQTLLSPRVKRRLDELGISLTAPASLV